MAKKNALPATVEEAYKATGRPKVDFSNVPEDLRDYFQAHYDAVVVTESLNQGEKLSWDDSNQRKYYPWFYNDGSGSGFEFYFTCYVYSGADAGRASRLCLPTRELAEYSGKTFTEVHDRLLRK